MIDAAIRVYLRNFGKLAKLAAAVALPVFVIVLIVNLAAYQEVDPLSSGAKAYTIADSSVIHYFKESSLTIALIVQSIVTLIGFLLVIGAAFKAVSEAYLGKGFGELGSLTFALRKAPSLLWLIVLLAIGLALAAVALFLPFIWLVVAWSVAVPVLMIENQKGTAAIRRSFRLTRSHWFRTFGALLIGFIFIALLQVLIGIADASALKSAPDHFSRYIVIRGVLTAIGLIIGAPLQAAIVTVIYYDLRVRKEGFDVELLGQQLEAPAPAAPAYPQAGSPAPAPRSAPPPGEGPPPPGSTV